MRYLIAYVAALLVMGVLDALWLGVIAKSMYRDAVGHLLADEVRIGAAVAFYLLYAGGVVIFAAVPALKAASAARALGQGALFGFFAYMTYDLTNLATLRDWPLGIAVIDIGWGTFLSACTAAAAYLAAAQWQARASLKGQA